MAAHHAGMVPPFKEAVEACFAEGLVKVVFATETLALGINMPARTVVIEKLTKFTGERHEFLTPGDYTQLTGRAGRRGIDPVGHAVVLWSPFVPFEQVAALAASRSFRLDLRVPAHLQHGRQPRAALRRRRGPPPPQPQLRPVPGRPVGRRPGDPARAPRGAPRRGRGAGDLRAAATSASTPTLRKAEEDERRRLRPSAAGDRRGRGAAQAGRRHRRARRRPHGRAGPRSSRSPTARARATPAYGCGP